MPSIDVKKNSKIFIGVGAVVLFALGIVIGRFLLGGGGATGSLNGRTTLSEGELNTPIASYTYNGQTKEVTAREVIENTSGLDAAKQSDGTYAVPAADKIIGYVRNALVVAEAQSQGISVSDQEVSDYMQTNFKTTDVSQVASAYKLSEDVAKKLINDAVIMKKYRDKVLTTKLPDAPQAPTAPEDGNSETTSQEYAQYIIGLAGDEWDATNNTWASQDGDYYKQLSAYSISKDSASYAAAQTAYQVAMSKYSAVASKASQEWSQKINEILGKASIAVYSLAL
ncbi:MAG: hypothetical protein E6191_05045 [Atopobium sp.]|nr:hypothetical protein [Atopobium sp.]MBF0909950.1 hypothetical protein [Atopobium sp.]MDU5217740.1 hypothetical protein [Atopobium sp.]